MKITMSYKVILAGAVGILIGAVAMRAQQAKTAPGYVVAEVQVTDPAGMQPYGQQAPGTISAFGGKYVVIGGKPVALEGEAPPSLIVLQFGSVEKAKAWYDSPAYSAIRPIRQRSAKSTIFIVEGVQPQ
jgi:uncharacterized protein (DUF1330 family)